MGRLKDDENALIELCNYDLFGRVHFKVTKRLGGTSLKTSGKGVDVKINQLKSTTPMARVGSHATVAQQQAYNSTVQLLTIPRLLVPLMAVGNVCSYVSLKNTMRGPVVHI